ncbi:hypothetical protein GQ43DRAFT_63898 [Delitschia confertaspora ATCC 74209]|uniref:Uncharacterized protein n=1 Tax=Delitschia confertaspora ATCC 74209 TaxID=1513339 RepID=A0A9P4MYB1_9PLEO|nr:hypothetical protein GQ43DRAFT_63898 [Delitschia confertaspora ATCC 74209]
MRSFPAFLSLPAIRIIIVLDGGNIRGVSQLLILDEIMHKIKCNRDLQNYSGLVIILTLLEELAQEAHRSYAWMIANDK